MLRALFHAVALVSVFFLALTAQAQRMPPGRSLPAQVSGQIRYAQGSRPAEFVLVRIENFDGGIAAEVTTDRNGKFIAAGLYPAIYIVSVRVAGFRETSQQVDLRTQLTDYLQLQLVADNEGPGISSLAKGGGVIDAKVPHDALTEFEKGRDELLRDKDIDAGILHLENAVKIYPGYFEAALLLGTAYMDQSNWGKAEASLKRASDLDPKAANPLFALGELYIKQKKDDDAEKALRQGLQIEDRSYQGHLSLGRVYWYMAAKFKDEAHYRPLLEKSYEQAKRALQLKPDLADGHLLKGNLYFKARRAEDALHEFEEYLRLDPNGQYAEQTRALAERIKKALSDDQKKP